MDLIYKILIVVLAIAIFVISYLLNQRTKVPNGCDNIDNCNTCGNKQCINRKINNKEQNNNEK